MEEKQEEGLQEDEKKKIYLVHFIMFDFLCVCWHLWFELVRSLMLHGTIGEQAYHDLGRKSVYGRTGEVQCNAMGRGLWKKANCGHMAKL